MYSPRRADVESTQVFILCVDPTVSSARSSCFGSRMARSGVIASPSAQCALYVCIRFRSPELQRTTSCSSAVYLFRIQILQSYVPFLSKAYPIPRSESRLAVVKVISNIAILSRRIKLAAVARGIINRTAIPGESALSAPMLPLYSLPPIFCPALPAW